MPHTMKDNFSCLKLSNKFDNYCEKCDSNEIRVINRNFCRNI